MELTRYLFSMSFTAGIVILPFHAQRNSHACDLLRGLCTLPTTFITNRPLPLGRSWPSYLTALPRPGECAGGSRLLRLRLRLSLRLSLNLPLPFPLLVPLSVPPSLRLSPRPSLAFFLSTLPHPLLLTPLLFALRLLLPVPPFSLPPSLPLSLPPSLPQTRTPSLSLFPPSLPV